MTGALEEALRLAALGLRVVPIGAGQKYPWLDQWQRRATDDATTIRQWWSRRPDSGVGLAMGDQPCGVHLFALDFDVHGDRDGLADWRALCAEHGPVPATWESITGSGGRHMIFCAPAGVTVTNQQASGNRLAPGIDVRGQGGQIVVAPTAHVETGVEYAWSPFRAPGDIEPAGAPAWLVEALTAPLPVVEPQRCASAPVARPERPQRPTAGDDETAADWLRRHWSWPVELESAGWSLAATKGNGDTWWSRPGKDPRAGHSAVLHGVDGPLVVFTTEVPPGLGGKRTADGSGVSVSPLDFHAARHHGGDVSAASRALRAQMPRPSALGARVIGGAVGGDEVDDGQQGDGAEVDPDDELRAHLVDWSTFWDRDRDDAEWLAEPIIAAKRGTALFAPGGTGKSLLALYIAATLATGRPLFGAPAREPVRVLYLDYEMTDDDLAERLAAMGFGADTDLAHLAYALLPSLPPLDTAEGGRAVVRLAEIVDAELVVIDTFARAVEGDENEADTVRNLYRWTGLHLKHAGRAFVRVDHAGKDLAKGQRGTSAKNDDVDVVWQMTAKDRGGYQLVAKKRRMGWVPEHVNLELSEGGRLAFNLAEGVAYPAGTVDVVNELDRLGVPVELSATKATKAYRAAGGSARNEVLRAAQRYRQRRSVDSYLVGDEAMATARQPVDNIVDKPVDNSGRGAGRGTSETGRGAVGRGDPLETVKPQLDDRAPQIGARWGAVGAVTGARCGPPNGATRPPPGPDEHSDDVDNLPW